MWSPTLSQLTFFVILWLFFVSSTHELFIVTLFCLACNTVLENWHIYVNKGLTYLLTYLCVALEIIQLNEA